MAATVSASGCTSAGTVISYDPTELSIPNDSNPVSMKIRPGYLKGSGDITIPVSFNGHTESCLIDTGTPQSVAFSNDFFESLPTGGRIWMWGMGGENVPSFLAVVDKLEIGGITLADQKFALNTNQRGKILPFQCILGLDILSHGAMSFDFTHKTFRLLHKIPASLVKHELMIHPTGQFAVPFSIGDQPILTIWDTGAETTTIDPEFMRAHAADFEKITDIDPGTDIISTSGFKLSVYTARKVRLADKEYSTAVVTASPVSIARNMRNQAIVGFELIRLRNWVFDLSQKQWAQF